MADDAPPKYKRTTIVFSESILQEVDRRRRQQVPPQSRSEYVEEVLDMFFRTELGDLA